MTIRGKKECEADLGVVRSLERIHRNLREHGRAGRTFMFVEPELDVRKIREKLRMSQSEFASKFAISIKTLRNWEQGISNPEGAARAYLLVIKHDPEHVTRALAAEGSQLIEVQSEIPEPTF